MKALYSWFLVAAVGVAALSFVPTPAAAETTLERAARMIACGEARDAYAALMEDCMPPHYNIQACDDAYTMSFYVAYVCENQ